MLKERTIYFQEVYLFVRRCKTCNSLRSCRGKTIFEEGIISAPPVWYISHPAASSAPDIGYALVLRVRIKLSQGN